MRLGQVQVKIQLAVKRAHNEEISCRIPADFFDQSHLVLKGASQATARELLRPSFSNWFRPRYPYVYATFRTVERQP